MATTIAFAEFAAENFLSMAEITWELTGGLVRARFGVEEMLVEVRFEPTAAAKWTVSFDLQTTPKSVAYLAFHMFNGVFQAVEEFLRVRNPDALIFVSKREDLSHIYETYLRREQGRIEELGYRLSEAQRLTPFTEYVLERVEASDRRAA